MRAVAATGAQEGVRLPEAQLGALEQAQADKEAQGEFEREGPGEGGAQDTFYGGTGKGGRLYPQPFLAPYSKGALAQLSGRQPPLTAADSLTAQGGRSVTAMRSPSAGP